MIDISKIYNQFDKNAHAAFRRAMDISGGKRFVGVEHLFMAIYEIDPDLVKLAFDGTDVSNPSFIQRFREDTLRFAFEPNWEHVINTPRTREVLQLAYNISLQKDSSPITPKHLLLAILQEGESEVVKQIRSMGIDERDVIGRLGHKPKSEENEGGENDAQQNKSSSPKVTLFEANEKPKNMNIVVPTFSETPKKRQQGTANKYRTISTPTLDAHGRDLTKLAEEGKSTDIVGREEELKQLMVVLCAKDRGNAVLIGEPGVGKSVMVHGLAHRILSEDVPPMLANCRIVQIDPADISAGTRYVGDIEQRVKSIVSECEEAGNIILFIDEIHSLTRAGATSTHDPMNAAQILKPALANGILRVIGATTSADYAKYIETDKALARRFQVIRIEEPTPEETLQILRGMRRQYEEYHQVKLPDEVLKAIVQLTQQHLPHLRFPDKALCILDQVATTVAVFKANATTLPVVSINDVQTAVAQMSKLPASHISLTPSSRFLEMEDFLNQQVLGQESAIKAITEHLRLTATSFRLHPHKPKGVFLLAGPTGVGKTETARALAFFLHGDQDRMVRLDMSEFANRGSVWSLVGSSAGFVGYEQGGRLTEAIKQQPDALILLDEIEKAHPEVHQLFLQVFDDGRLTDNKGDTVSFKDTVIIMTSNVGGELFMKSKMGFGADISPQPQVSHEQMLKALQKTFAPEFINRVQVVQFQPLSPDVIKEITRQKLFKIAEQLKEEGKELHYDEAVIELLSKLGYRPNYGARALERVIQKEVLTLIADNSYKPDWRNLKCIRLLSDNDKVKIVLELHCN